MEGPTAKDLWENEEVKKALEEAWKLSFLKDKGEVQERGGWIYALETDVKKIYISKAPADRSEPFSEHSEEIVTIDLTNPPVNPPDPPQHYKIVANYHTHPLEINQEPSRADMENAYGRGVPGIVVSKRTIWGYGPLERETMNGSVGYPNPGDSWSGQQARKIANNPF